MLTLGKDNDDVERRLKKYRLRCPGCGGRLAPWGHGRERSIWGPLPRRWRLRPRWARCQRCGTTHMLLPVNMLWRRRDDVAVIGDALVRAACGQGFHTIARDSGRSPAMVRGWLRRMRQRAPGIRVAFTRLLVELDPDPPPLVAAASVMADAVNAVLAVGAAAGRRFPALAGLPPWELACAVTAGCCWPRRPPGCRATRTGLW